MSDPAAAAACVLAVDIGSTHMRAALIGGDGTVRARADRPAPTAGIAATEIAPKGWWDTLLALATDLDRHEPEAFDAVAGTAICGVTRTQVFLDATGQSLRPALLWTDTRAADIAAEMAEGLDVDTEPEARWLNPFHPAPRLLWLQRHEPDSFARLHTVVEPKDYLNARLTGAVAGDGVSQARLRAAEPLLRRAGIANPPLPPLHAITQAVGSVRHDAPPPFDHLAGRPAFCGSNDTWAAVLGLGALRPGMAYNITGTTEVFGTVTDRRLEAEGLLTVDWGDGLWQLGGPGQNGGESLRWLLQQLGAGDDFAECAALLAQPRHPQPLICLPFLRGERAPFWDADLRGAFLGLTLGHGRADMLWAMLEGLALVNRVVLRRAEAALGHPVGEVRFGGGGARLEPWAQIKADVLGRPVVTGAGSEAGLLGAAMVAWTGLGHCASLAEAQDRLAPAGEPVHPDPARAAWYNDLAGLFDQGHTATASLSHRLARFGKPPC
jgi:xylulokinase